MCIFVLLMVKFLCLFAELVTPTYRDVMKRSLDIDALACDDYFYPLRPAKRLTMMDNTPQQLKQERRHVLRMSKQKLKAMENPLRDLQKSVLLKNTMRLMKQELQENGAKKYRGYKRNHASIPYQRKLKLQQQASSWEATVEGVYPKTTSCSQANDSGSSSKCASKLAASELGQTSCDVGSLTDTMLSHMMDVTEAASRDCDVMQSSDHGCEIGARNASADCDSSNTDNRDKQDTNSSCETDDNSQESAYLSSDKSHSDGAVSASCVVRSCSRQDNHTSLAKAAETDITEQINGCNYEAAFRLHSHAANSKLSTVFPSAVASPLAAQSAAFYTALYADVPFKQYYNTAAYAAYVHSLHQQHRNFALHHQYLLTLTEMMRNNRLSQPSANTCYYVTGDYVSSHDDYERMDASCSDSDDDTYIDIMT